MSILKSLNLGTEKKKETIEDLNFIFKKKRSSGSHSNRRQDLIEITPNVIAIRKDVAAAYDIGKGWYGALILDEQRVSLILRKSRDENLYAVQGSDKHTSKHINIPKASRDLAKNFKGKYEIQGDRMIEEKYLVLELLKVKDS